MTSGARPLLDCFPALATRVPFADLGVWPTPVEHLAQLGEKAGLRAPLYVKRDDVSSPIYGGNKVRTLEVLFGEALAKGHTHIYSTGAYGTNHGLATILHAPRVGLEPGVILFPQPASYAALENLRAMLSQAPHVVDLANVALLPFGMVKTARLEAHAGHATTIMVPGGATPTGGLGYVNAALELAQQVARGELPPPAHVVVGVGSTCTSAGLLVGLRLAARLGVGFAKAPTVHAIRVTPWPVTARFRIVGLAARIAARLAELTGERIHAESTRALSGGLEVTGAHLGFGYGHPTRDGRAALALFADTHDLPLDTTYSAKAAAGAIAIARRTPEPVLYWSTKSTVPLPPPTASLDLAPPRLKRWIRKAEAALGRRGELPPGYVCVDERGTTP